MKHFDKQPDQNHLPVENVNDEDVAEWVGLHYARNFDAEPPHKQAEWRARYATQPSATPTRASSPPRRRC